MTQTGRYKVELCAGLEGFDQATSLLLDSDSPDIYSTRTWFENLARFGIEANAEVILARVQCLGTGRAFCLPLRTRTGSPVAIYGESLESLSNYYSSLYAPIGQPDATVPGALTEILAALRRSTTACDVIDLHPLDPEDSFFLSTRSALQQSGYWIDKYFCFGNWHLEVGGRTFAAYEGNLPSRLRNTIRRGRRKLEASGNWSLEIHSTPGPGLDAAISAFETIYSRSWKRPEPYPLFIDALCRTAAAQGWLRLGVVHIEGRPAAAQIWLHRLGRSAIFKLAHDEELKAYSAGSVLTASLMEFAIDTDRAVEVDYLTGDEPYKADWMSNRRERVGLVAFRKGTLQGSLSALRHYAGRWLRAQIRNPEHKD